jgi:gamma-glutamylputrescine oxidase
MLGIYPQMRDVKIDYAWGGTLAITMNRMPAVLRLHPNVLAASACSGHGVAMATMTGRILAEAIHAQSGAFDLLAALPKPSFPGGAAFRWPLLVLAMTWYSMRDRLGL